MRESQRKLRELCSSRNADKNFLSRLDDIHWLEYIHVREDVFSSNSLFLFFADASLRRRAHSGQDREPTCICASALQRRLGSHSAIMRTRPTSTRSLLPHHQRLRSAYRKGLVFIRAQIRARKDNCHRLRYCSILPTTAHRTRLRQVRGHGAFAGLPAIHRLRLAASAAIPSCVRVQLDLLMCTHGRSVRLSLRHIPIQHTTSTHEGSACEFQRGKNVTTNTPYLSLCARERLQSGRFSLPTRISRHMRVTSIPHTMHEAPTVS